MSKKKTIAATAFLATLVTLAILIIPIFWINHNASPLGTYIDVYVLCDETGAGIEGVRITVVETQDSKVTDADGFARFGSGYSVGTYTVTFMWNLELQSQTVEVTCEKQYWEVIFRVPNPTIIKHFVYASGQMAGQPVPGVTVELWVDTDGNGVPDNYVTEAVTDEFGTVTFGGDVVAVCKIYYLKYTWNGVVTLIGPIHFTAESCAETIVWEETNELEPKSGGGNKLHLVEELG